MKFFPKILLATILGLAGLFVGSDTAQARPVVRYYYGNRYYVPRYEAYRQPYYYDRYYYGPVYRHGNYYYEVPRYQYYYGPRGRVRVGPVDVQW